MSNYYETLISFHKEPVLLPASTVYENLQFIICAVIFVCCIHLCFYSILLQRSVTSTHEPTTSNGTLKENGTSSTNGINHKDTTTTAAIKLKSTKQKVMKASYQATNFFVNVFLGCYGMYHLLTQPIPDPSPTITQRLLFPPSLSVIPLQHQILNNTQFATFGSLQIAYNLWAVPIGFFYVGESALMLSHHFCAIFTGIMVSTFSHGFRFHTPMLYGCMELSSVPLAIVNYFKDHKEWTKQHCPSLFDTMKVLFAVLFLWLRCLLSSTHMYHIVSNSALLWYSSYQFTDPVPSGSSDNIGEGYLYSYYDGVLYRVIMGGFSLCGVLLTFLQYYWGVLIIKQLIRMVPKKEENTKKKE